MSVNVVPMNLVAHYQRFTRQVQYLTGNYFQMGNDNVNLILPLQISSFIYCHVLAYSLLWLFTAVTTSAVK